MRTFNTRYRFGWARFPPLPTHHYYPLPSTDETHTAPSTPGVDLDGLDLLSFLPHPPPFLHGRHLPRRPPPRTIQGHHGLLLRPTTFVGSISAHEIAADSIASSGNGAVDTGSRPGSAFRPLFVLSIAHRWRPRFSPSNSSSGLSSPELPSLHRRDWKRWIKRRFRRHSPRRRRPDALSLPHQAAVNYVRPSSPSGLAAASPSTPRTWLISPPRTLPAPSTTN